MGYQYLCQSLFGGVTGLNDGIGRWISLISGAGALFARAFVRPPGSGVTGTGTGAWVRDGSGGEEMGFDTCRELEAARTASFSGETASSGWPKIFILLPAGGDIGAENVH